MDLKDWHSKLREKALKALDKPSPYGLDIDISQYLELGEVESISKGLLDVSKAEEVGVNLNANALYIQVDQSYFKYLSRIPGVEVYRIEDFIEQKPDEAMEFAWRLVDPSTDKFTALAYLRGRGGYFIRVKKGSKVDEPIMACLYMSYKGLQAPHNIVVVEDGAEATVYTGCTIAPEVLGLHVGISEFFVGRKAKLRFVMVHSWNKVAHVRPRTVVSVDEEGEYISYYVNISKVKTLQTYPKVYLSSNAKAFLASILLGLEDSDIDVGSAAYIEGDGASAELVSRAIARDESKIVMRAQITGGRMGKGHIDCRGLMMSNNSLIQTVPELIAKHPDVILTHEASIGRLAEDEINYLISKGFSRDEAISALVRGFATIDISDLPEKVRNYIETIEKIVSEKAL
ncbi:MAG: SufD family Fe-S cluster assembly protein [Ignisphaera sp.]